MNNRAKISAGAFTAATILLLLAGLVPAAIITAFVAAFAYLNIDT